MTDPTLPADVPPYWTDRWLHLRDAADVDFQRRWVIIRAETLEICFDQGLQPFHTERLCNLRVAPTEYERCFAIACDAFDCEVRCVDDVEYDETIRALLWWCMKSSPKSPPPPDRRLGAVLLLQLEEAEQRRLLTQDAYDDLRDIVALIHTLWHQWSSGYHSHILDIKRQLRHRDAELRLALQRPATADRSSSAVADVHDSCDQTMPSPVKRTVSQITSTLLVSMMDRGSGTSTPSCCDNVTQTPVPDSAFTMRAQLQGELNCALRFQGMLPTAMAGPGSTSSYAEECVHPICGKHDAAVNDLLSQLQHHMDLCQQRLDDVRTVAHACGYALGTYASITSIEESESEGLDAKSIAAAQEAVHKARQEVVAAMSTAWGRQHADSRSLLALRLRELDELDDRLRRNSCIDESELAAINRILSVSNNVSLASDAVTDAASCDPLQVQMECLAKPLQLLSFAQHLRRNRSIRKATHAYHIALLKLLLKRNQENRRWLTPRMLPENIARFGLALKRAGQIVSRIRGCEAFEVEFSQGWPIIRDLVELPRLLLLEDTALAYATSSLKCHVLLPSFQSESRENDKARFLR